MDSSTTWVDDFCCPLYIKAKIFSFWTLTHGIGIAVISSYSLLHSQWHCEVRVKLFYVPFNLVGSFRDDEKVLLIYHLATLFALIHIVAGIFMHIGIFQVRTVIKFNYLFNYFHLINQNAPRMYLTGIILSWMLPMFCLPFIYLPGKQHVCKKGIGLNAVHLFFYILLLVMQIFFTITSYRFFLLELNK